MSTRGDASTEDSSEEVIRVAQGAVLVEESSSEENSDSESGSEEETSPKIPDTSDKGEGDGEEEAEGEEMEVDVETISPEAHVDAVQQPGAGQGEDAEEEEGRPVVGAVGEPSTSGDYVWVSPEMLNLKSFYDHGTFLEGFISKYKISETIPLPQLRVFPAPPHCRVYHRHTTTVFHSPFTSMTRCSRGLGLPSPSRLSREPFSASSMWLRHNSTRLAGHLSALSKYWQKFWVSLRRLAYSSASSRKKG